MVWNIDWGKGRHLNLFKLLKVQNIWNSNLMWFRFLVPNFQRRLWIRVHLLRTVRARRDWGTLGQPNMEILTGWWLQSHLLHVDALVRQHFVHPSNVVHRSRVSWGVWDPSPLELLPAKVILEASKPEQQLPQSGGTEEPCSRWREPRDHGWIVRVG